MAEATEGLHETEGAAPGTVLILVDGSNIAYAGGATPKLRHLLAVINRLETDGFRSIVIVDAALRHRIDDQAALEGLIDSGSVLQAPAGRTADEFILQLAERKWGAGVTVYVLTNDLFPEEHGRGHIARIAFLKVALEGDEVWLFSPVLESVIPREFQVA